MKSTIAGVLLTPLRIIEAAEGDVLHGMKCSDLGFSGFGEAYFSTVNAGFIKAWKRHREMTLNLIVPKGEIKFVIYDDRAEDYQYQEILLSRNNYQRLTIPPMVWLGFKGLGEGTSMLLNIADIEHKPEEADKKDLIEIEYNWSK